MMGILDYLAIDDKWQEFYDAKVKSNNMTKSESSALLKFINTKQYLNIANKIIDETYNFSMATKKLINKSVDKKRTVYIFDHDEVIILKFLAHFASCFEGVFANLLFSFRKHRGPKQAIKYLMENSRGLAYYKVDIHNYFNSINLQRLYLILQEKITDTAFVRLLIKLLDTKEVMFDGNVITEEHGVMAGMPLASFLANLYLSDMDHYFQKKGVVYARYSDDIIVFADQENITAIKDEINSFISRYDLTINPDKQYLGIKDEAWEFLGFSFNNGVVDISINSKAKLKAKIKRKAKSLYRWKIRKNVADSVVIKKMISIFNKKFYATEQYERTWSRWYFPVITTTAGLKEIDNYLQDNLRYLVSGKYSKSNYKVANYSLLKKLNYVTLVNQYYEYIKEN